MAEKHTESSKYPKYENELDNYSQKIRSKLEDFQKARREWTKWSDKPKEVSINVEKEEWTTSYYNGSILEIEGKSDPNDAESEGGKKVIELEANDTDLEKSEKKEEKGRLLKKKLKKEEAEKSLDPTKKILKKLKTQSNVEKCKGPCKCENGKEVTFIIKGLCLCDDAKLKNFATHETCGQYCKTKINQISQEPLDMDYSETSKTSSDDKIVKEEEKKPKKQKDDVDKINEKDVKLTETSEELKEEKLVEEVSETNEVARKSTSFIILFKNDNTEMKSEMALTYEQKKALEKHPCQPRDEKKYKLN